MIIDITALTWMIRRMDVSATLKTFSAAFAFLTVVFYLQDIFGFVVDTFRYELDLVNADSIGWFASSVGLMIIAAFTPLAFILWDWVARQPWRVLAAVNGVLLGSLAAAGLAGLLGAFLWFVVEQFDEMTIVERGILSAVVGASLAVVTTWMVGRSRRLRLSMMAIVVAAVAAVLFAFLYGIIYDVLQGGRGDPREELIHLLGLGFSVVSGAWLLIRTIRHRIILSGNRPRELFLGALYRKGFWVRLAFLVGLPSSLWNLAAMITPAFWAFLLARPAFYGGVLVLLGAAGQLDPAQRILLGVALVVSGHLLFYVAKRLASRRAWEPDKVTDTRAPVLFLRSFEDDQLRFRRPWWKFIDRWFDLWSFRRNADEAMIDEIAQYGPVVALGMPGEDRVPFGARRYYSSHDDWQDIVTKIATAAQAIVIAAGTSPGVQWEYALLARENLQGKTLLLFPPASTAEGRARNSDALRAFTDAVDIAHDYTVPEGQEMIALLPSADGPPTLLTSNKATASAYVAAVRGYFQECTVDELADPLLI